MPRRVAVTGLGVISAIGHNSSEFWQSLQAGLPGIATLQAVDPALLRFSSGAEVRNYAPARYFDEKDLGLLDRFAQFGVIAAREAIAEGQAELYRQALESARAMRPRSRRTICAASSTRCRSSSPILPLTYQGMSAEISRCSRASAFLCM